MADGDVILTRDKSSGRIHKRVVLGTELATLEADNLDQSGAFQVLGPEGEIDLAEFLPEELCKRCFDRVAATS